MTAERWCPNCKHSRLTDGDTVKVCRVCRTPVDPDIALGDLPEFVEEYLRIAEDPTGREIALGYVDTYGQVDNEEELEAAVQKVLKELPYYVPELFPKSKRRFTI